ncbi:MAG: hypothetical protein KC713_08465, partial [Candidatus Omnitrophica bacterium]|nr:hypothetical protein [Candidatus Omnitrophota bacterium]
IIQDLAVSESAEGRRILLEKVLPKALESNSNFRNSNIEGRTKGFLEALNESINSSRRILQKELRVDGENWRKLSKATQERIQSEIHDLKDPLKIEFANQAEYDATFKLGAENKKDLDKSLAQVRTLKELAEVLSRTMVQADVSTYFSGFRKGGQITITKAEASKVREATEAEAAEARKRLDSQQQSGSGGTAASQTSQARPQAPQPKTGGSSSTAQPGTASIEIHRQQEDIAQSRPEAALGAPLFIDDDREEETITVNSLSDRDKRKVRQTRLKEKAKRAKKLNEALDRGDITPQRHKKAMENLEADYHMFSTSGSQRNLLRGRLFGSGMNNMSEKQDLSDDIVVRSSANAAEGEAWMEVTNRRTDKAMVYKLTDQGDEFVLNPGETFKFFADNQKLHKIGLLGFYVPREAGTVENGIPTVDINGQRVVPYQALIANPEEDADDKYVRVDIEAVDNELQFVFFNDKDYGSDINIVKKYGVITRTSDQPEIFVDLESDEEVLQSTRLFDILDYDEVPVISKDQHKDMFDTLTKLKAIDEHGKLVKKLPELENDHVFKTGAGKNYQKVLAFLKKQYKPKYRYEAVKIDGQPDASARRVVHRVSIKDYNKCIALTGENEEKERYNRVFNIVSAYLQNVIWSRSINGQIVKIDYQDDLIKQGILTRRKNGDIYINSKKLDELDSAEALEISNTTSEQKQKFYSYLKNKTSQTHRTQFYLTRADHDQLTLDIVGQQAVRVNEDMDVNKHEKLKDYLQALESALEVIQGQIAKQQGLTSAASQDAQRQYREDFEVTLELEQRLQDMIASVKKNNNVNLWMDLNMNTDNIRGIMTDILTDMVSRSKELQPYMADRRWESEVKPHEQRLVELDLISQNGQLNADKILALRSTNEL